MYLLVDAAKPTTDLRPEWHTSIPMSMVFMEFRTAGNCMVKRSPPDFEFIYLMMLLALEALKPRALREVTT